MATMQRSLGGKAQAGSAVPAIEYTIGQSSLGRVLVANTTRGICAVLLGDNDSGLVDDLEHRFPRAASIRKAFGAQRLADGVIEFLDGEAHGMELPLDLRGTEFQRSVWTALRQIPRGETTTYSALAARIGRPRAVRAVAGACAANPIAVVIPCHRVVRGDGGLSGYRWGVERKRQLLELEAMSG